MAPIDLNHRLYDQPFKPFRIHLSDGSTIPVANAGTILVGESSAILPTEMARDAEGFPVVKRWRNVALSHMVQFSDLDESVGGKRPKKKR
jgi:hypothetical protein